MRIIVFFIAAASIQGFVVTRTHRPATVALQAENGSGMARMFGLVAAVSVFSLSSPPAMAADLPVPLGKPIEWIDWSCSVVVRISNTVTYFSIAVLAPFTSSTVNVAEAIKILDMGLPSYGDIKDSKASVSNVKSLSTEATGMMSKSKRSSGDDSSVEETKPIAPKQAYTPASKERYVPKQEKATSLPTYEF